MEKLKGGPRELSSFFQQATNSWFWGSSHMIPQWQNESLLPDTQTQKPGGHFAWLKPKSLKTPKCERGPAFPCQWGDGGWSPARGDWAVVFAKWYSWKALENRAALDRSNDDPAGRAEQLKTSPGERWELLTATEGLYSGALSRPRADENIAGNTKKH